METIKKYAYPIIIVILLFAFFIERSCNKPNGTQKVEVVIPAKTVQIPKETSIQYLPSKPQIIKVAGKKIKTENPINEQMLKEFILTKDSLKLIKYVKAIEEKEQIRTFDKDGITVNVKSKTRGDLLEQSIVTTIKEQKVKAEVPIKTRTAVYVGLGVSNNRDLTNFAVQAEIGLQIKRDIIAITVDTKQNFGVKYIIKL